MQTVPKANYTGLAKFIHKLKSINKSLDVNKTTTIKQITLPSGPQYKQFDEQGKRPDAHQDKKETWMRFFEGNRTVYPIYSRSRHLSTYPTTEKLKESAESQAQIGFAKSSDYVTEQFNQFKVTDQTILNQFPDYKNRNILVSETLYDVVDLWRFVDAYRSDGQVRNVITTMIKYTLGNGRPKIVIDVNDYFSSTDEEQTALEQVLQNPEYKEIARQISKENRRIGFHEVMIACLVDNAIYGRAAARKVYYDPNKDRIPNSVLKKLGLDPQKR